MNKTDTQNTYRKITLEEAGGSNYGPGCFWIFVFSDSAREASKDVETFLNLRFIKKQKPAGVFLGGGGIFYANELKVKNVSLNVPDLL